MNDNFYGRTDNPEDSGAIDNNYLIAGKAAYEAYIVATGEQHACSWDLLIWPQQYAWCQAARAVIQSNY